LSHSFRFDLIPTTFAFRKLKSMMRTGYGLVAITALVLVCCAPPKEKKPEVDPLKINYAIRSVWPHDTEAFTQGLVIHKGELYESTGQFGTSWIGLVDVATGKLDKKVILDQKYFGEGIDILNNKVYQLTWQEHTGFVYDLKDFKKIKEWTYKSEGWGLTNDGANIIMSDGSDKLHFLDTVTLDITKTVSVTDEEDNPVKNLNELEYIDGFVFANVWQTNKIMKIDPASGNVVGRLDLTQLYNDARKANPRMDVLNGIAWHPGTQSLLVTGKHWPHIYILKIDSPKPTQ
jgi:glutamine cyclotransferase